MSIEDRAWLRERHLLEHAASDPYLGPIMEARVARHGALFAFPGERAWLELAVMAQACESAGRILEGYLSDGGPTITIDVPVRLAWHEPGFDDAADEAQGEGTRDPYT